MINQSNLPYIEGTEAKVLQSNTEDAIIVSYQDEVLKRKVTRNIHAKRHDRARFEAARNLRGPETTISRSEYLFGLSFCFAGSVLVFLLGLIF